jgi:hypothetical protein
MKHASVSSTVHGGPLLAWHALELQHDPQRRRHLGHVLLALSGAFEQVGKLAPGEFRAVFLGQVFLDQHPDVAERRKLDNVGNDDRARQGARPIRGGQVVQNATQLTVDIVSPQMESSFSPKAAFV